MRKIHIINLIIPAIAVVAVMTTSIANTQVVHAVTKSTVQSKTATKTPVKKPTTTTSTKTSTNKTTTKPATKAPVTKPVTKPVVKPTTPTPVDFINTKGEGDKRNAGVFNTPTEKLVTININAGYEANFSKINGMIGSTYGLRYVPSLSKDGVTSGMAKFTWDKTNNRYGLEISGWRHSKDTNVAENNALNAVLETFYAFCGDKEVAYSLWSWIDTRSIYGSANTNTFGFKDLRITKNGAVIGMKGVEIEIIKGDKTTTAYFNTAPKSVEANNAPIKFVNTKGEGDKRNAGVFSTPSEKLVTISKNAGYDTNFSKINGMIGSTYGLRYIPGMSKDGVTESTFYFQYDKANNRYGLKVTGWRHSKDTNVAENNALNAVLETFYFFCGDKEVAYALWSWFDAKNIDGYANTDDFGFKDTGTGKNGFTAIMNGIEVEIIHINGVTTVYFN